MIITLVKYFLTWFAIFIYFSHSRLPLCLISFRYTHFVFYFLILLLASQRLPFEGPPWNMPVNLTRVVLIATFFTYRGLCFDLLILVLSFLTISALALLLQNFTCQQLLADFRTEDAYSYVKSFSYKKKLLKDSTTSSWWRVVTWTQIGATGKCESSQRHESRSRSVDPSKACSKPWAFVFKLVLIYANNRAG